MKWLNDRLELFLIPLLLGGVFFLTFRLAPDAPFSGSVSYANNLFDDSVVHEIRVTLPDSSLEKLLTDSADKEKFLANVSIDGNFLEGVSFSTRGNASLEALSDSGDTKRFSYRLNFDYFSDGKNYFGLDKLVLNNLYADASYLKDYTAFQIMSAAGVETPLCSFANFYINDELIGLYLAIEDYDRSFLARTGSSHDAALFKPEALGHDKQRLRALKETLKEGEELDVEVDATSPDFVFLGADLVYRGDNPGAYSDIFSNSLVKHSPETEKYIIDGIRSLETLESPEKYWDIPALAKYFAAHNLIISDDSYTGYVAHNYVLKVTPSGSTFLPWDYNLAFNTHWYEGVSTETDNVVSIPIDEPLLGKIDLSRRPLWRLFAENDDYINLYHFELQSLLNKIFNNGALEEKLDEIVELITPSVEADPTRFYSLEDFTAAVDYMKSFLYRRSDFIQQEIWNLEKIPELSSED